MNAIPDAFQDLLADETRAFVYLATLMKDGSPQLTPVWFNTDGAYILIKSVRGNVKDHNMRARPRVALLIPDPKNPYRFVQIRGRVVEITEHGADAHIDALAGKYTGTPKYQYRGPNDQRVIYKIQPEKVMGH